MNIKVLQLWSILRSEEIKTLKTVIKNRGNNTLKSLFNFLKSNQNFTDKQEFKENAYLAIFKKSYTKTDDYLLRDAFRLLSTEMEHLLLQNRIQKDSKVMLYEELKSRGANDLSQKLLRKINEENLTTQEQFKIGECTLNYNINNIERPINKVNLHKVLDEVTELIKLNGTLYLEKYYQLLYYKAYLVRQLHAVEPDFVDSKMFDDVNPEHYLEMNEALEILSLKPGVHHIDSKTRIKTIEQLMNKCEDEPSKNQYQYQLGTEYLLKGEWENAIHHLDLSLCYYKESDHPHYPLMLFNYLSALAKTKQYIKVINTIQPEFLKIPALGPQFLSLYLSCLILNGNLEQAQKHFPTEINLGSDHLNNYLRMLQVMLHYENDLLELAENELSNLIRRFGKSSDVEPSIEATAQLLKQFLKYQLERNVLSKKAKESKESELRTTYQVTMKAYPFGVLPLIWLGNQLH